MIELAETLDRQESLLNEFQIGDVVNPDEKQSRKGEIRLSIKEY